MPSPAPDDTMPTSAVLRAPWRELAPETAYGIAQLRFIVFTTGQGITELDLDGVDLEPETLTYWIEDQGKPVATLRTLYSEEGLAIGRVATHPDHRGQGLAGRLMRAALADHPGEEMILHAQAYLESWYQGFGFRAVGPEYDEAGLPHLPMTRPAPATESQ